VEDNFEEYEREYAALSAGFRRQVTLEEYCGIKYRGRPRDSHRGNNDLGRKAGKMEIPPLMGQPNLQQSMGTKIGCIFAA
jgi:hypothetical protein